MAGISPQDFFKEKRSASEIKSEILNAYFKAWAAILLAGQRFKRVNKLLYIDLFAGKGVYDDGKPSTPIKILESIYASEGTFVDMNSAVQTIFNDKDSNLAAALKRNIESLPFYDKLVNKPLVANEAASQEILDSLVAGQTPSLTFIDPLGYGYTQQMLLTSVQQWGSDLFVLFNINRIRAAVSNRKVESNMFGIFSEKLDSIRDFYDENESPALREKFILEMFESIFGDRGFKTLRFQVNFPGRNQTSHYLYFVSKVNIAITRAKEIMSKYSDVQQDGVPLFGANIPQDGIFFPSAHEFSISNLRNEIDSNRASFNGKTLEQIYDAHNYGTHYIKANYKAAVAELMEANLVTLLDIKNQETSRLTYTAKLIFK
jgi:three-Cys-motif partner protein